MSIPGTVLAIAMMSMLISQACSHGQDSSHQLASLYDKDGERLPETAANSPDVAWRPVTPQEGLSGIGVLGASLTFWDQDVCTGFLVDTGVPSGPAYVISNAHCHYFEHFGWDWLGPEEVRIDQETSYHITMNHYVSVPADEREVFRFKKLVYYTEFGTDLAIFELHESLAAMAAAGYQALPLSQTRPPEGLPVSLIGVPLRSVEEAKQSLHISDCKLGATVKLKNGDYRYPESVRHRCSSIPGFSGGPLIDSAGQVVLFNSHGQDDLADAEPCSYAKAPCEVGSNGETTINAEVSYGQYVDGIASCFTPAGRFDLGHAGCRLAKP